jgi:hypothetical protein
MRSPGRLPSVGGMTERPSPLLAVTVFVVSATGAAYLWLVVLPFLPLTPPFDVLVLWGLAAAGLVGAVRVRREDSPDLLPHCLAGGALATLALAILLGMASVVLRDVT